MFKAAKWKSERNKIKAVFKFQFQATQVPHQGWEELMVSLFPMDVGKPTARSEKAAVVDGSCNWQTPVYETVRLTQDPKNGMINEKTYQLFLSSTGSMKVGVLGEAAINLADYADTFKPSSVSLPLKSGNSETVLHITVQRVQSEAEGRGTDEDRDTTMKNRNTLRSQLSNSEPEEEKTVVSLTNDIKITEEVSCVNNQANLKFPCSKTVTGQVESNAILHKSNSLDAISASGSDSSSGYNPKENGICNGTLISPLSGAEISQGLIIAAGNDWSIISSSIDGLSSSSGEALLREESQESDFISVTRQLEVSKLELQTLRKQVVKESRRGQELARELQSMKEERDALERECVELKASKRRAVDDEHVSTKLRFGGKDPWSMLDEAKQELNHEKKLNANLHLQLKKTQESNSELILAVRDLEELLQQKSKENCSCISSSTSIKQDVIDDLEEIKIETNFEMHQGSLETSAHEGDEQFALVRDVINSLDLKNAQLASELELYKEREEIEMQMEQLALDYEILKQENHDISTKLEQIQLREQLQMQFECSARFSSAGELEAQLECLEKELERQAEAFQAELEIISRAKIEQEKRSIQAEEVLRKTRLYNYNTAEQLQEEFKRLAAQMASSFYMNEKLVMQTLKESNELQMQKCHLEEMLEKKNKELELVNHQHCIKTQQLLNLIDFKTKEVDTLVLELKQKRKELESQKVAEEERQRASSEEIVRLTGEAERLLRNSDQLAEQIKIKDSLIEEMDTLKESIIKNDLLVHDFRMERSILGEELDVVKDELKKSRIELNELRKLKIENVEIQKEASVTSGIEKRLKEHNAKLTNQEEEIKSSKRSKIYRSTQAQLGIQDAYNLHANSLLFEETASNEDSPNEETKMKDVDSIGFELVQRRNGTHLEIEDEKPILCACKQKKTEKLSLEMEELKEVNQTMEKELKDMQERYSEMSLKFAEVEGERQLLVIKIRSLKNAMKS